MRNPFPKTDASFDSAGDDLRRRRRVADLGFRNFPPPSAWVKWESLKKVTHA